MLLFGYTTTFGCDCNGSGKFMEVAPISSLIAFIKIDKFLTYAEINGEKTPLSMEVEIIEKYGGNESRKKIVVFGDNGNLCRPYLSEFILGKYYVIAFDVDGKSQSDNSIQYYISSCGNYWLFVDNKLEFALGGIQEGKDKMSLAELKAQLAEY